MTDVTTALPADEVVCATIRRVIGAGSAARNEIDWPAPGASVFTDAMSHLCGGSRRASARLRAMRSRGLLESARIRRGLDVSWWLTPAGDALAETALPTCARCFDPIEPGLDASVCRSCLISALERRAAEEERSAVRAQEHAAEHEGRALSLRAEAAAFAARRLRVVVA